MNKFKINYTYNENGEEFNKIIEKIFLIFIDQNFHQLIDKAVFDAVLNK